MGREGAGSEGAREGGLQAEQLLTPTLLCLSSGDVFTDHRSSAH